MDLRISSYSPTIRPVFIVNLYIMDLRDPLLLFLASPSSLRLGIQFVWFLLYFHF